MGDSMFLAFLMVYTPHFGSHPAELWCAPWILLKRLTLVMDRVFHTAEDFRLPAAALVLVQALGRLRCEDWHGLHVTTSPVPWTAKVNLDILLNGPGPMGSHIIPQDIWDRAVPKEFYGGGGGA